MHLEHLALDEAAELGRFYAERADAPVALHLDHGVTFSVIEKAVARGFTSVMIDASKEDLPENIRRTREVVELAHAHGVTVEAEIGHVGTEEEGNDHALSENVYTEVVAAKELVRATGVDSLAVSIGTKHGAYKGEPHINFERLAELNDALGIPLVLHGGSGSGDENLARCAQGGVAKVNLYTDFIVAARDAGQLAPTCLLVGFAAETGDASGSVLEHGRAKLSRKGCDLLVVNEVGRGTTFGRDDNGGWILDSDGGEILVERGSKDVMAARILDAVVARSR